MKKFWYGVLAFAPIALIVLSLLSIVLFFVLILCMGVGVSAAGAEIEGVVGLLLGLLMMLFYAGFFGGIFGAVIINFVDIAVFCVHASKNPKVEDNMKVMWYCLFICMQSGVAPIYWWKYIKNE